jgi:hypothetical protein
LTRLGGRNSRRIKGIKAILELLREAYDICNTPETGNNEGEVDFDSTLHDSSGIYNLDDNVARKATQRELSQDSQNEEDHCMRAVASAIRSIFRIHTQVTTLGIDCQMGCQESVAQSDQVEQSMIVPDGGDNEIETEPEALADTGETVNFVAQGPLVGEEVFSESDIRAHFRIHETGSEHESLGNSRYSYAQYIGDLNALRIDPRLVNSQLIIAYVNSLLALATELYHHSLYERLLYRRREDISRDSIVFNSHSNA